MHGEGKKIKGSRVKGHSGVEKIFEFYALLATGFALRLWRVRRLGVGVMFVRALRCLQR